MPLGDVCVHVGTPIVTQNDPDEDTWVEGEPDEDPADGVPFDCFFMELRGASEMSSPVGIRKIKGPTILFEDERDDGSRVVLKAEDELWVLAEEVLGPDPVRFQVDGDPTPFQPPGEVIGWEALLKRVAGA